MKGMIMFVLIIVVIWGFWMSREWLINRRKWEDKEPEKEMGAPFDEPLPKKE